MEEAGSEGRGFDEALEDVSRGAVDCLEDSAVLLLVILVVESIREVKELVAGLVEIPESGGLIEEGPLGVVVVGDGITRLVVV